MREGGVKVITNNQPRPLVHDHELTPAEREQFDYLNWAAIDEGRDSVLFVRYKGDLLDLGTFERSSGQPLAEDLPVHLSMWDGYHSDSAFSAVALRYVKDDMGDDLVVVARVLS